MILLTGATGFVGNKIMEVCEDVVAAPSLRNANEDQIKRMIDESGADTIVNTAAVSDVRTCEENEELSYIANVQLPVLLAKASGGRKLICFSSDQVYTGLEDEGPYTEDRAAAANIYGKHKIEMEKRVLDICPDAVMLRAEWMYDHHSIKSNYYLDIVNARGTVSFSSREYRGITYVKEVAENIKNVRNLPGGIYNFGSETKKSMYEITRQFIDELGLNIRLEDAPAGHNLWMDCSKAGRHGIIFSDVSEALMKCARDNGLNSK